MANSKKPLPFWLKIMFLLNVILSLALVGAYLSTHFSPNTLPYLYFLGLGYPILLGFTLAFILFWFLFKRRYIWLNVAVLLLGWNHLNHFISIGLISEVPQANSLKIISYNVRIFDLYNTKHRIESRNGIFDFLQTESPDIACFQEFYHQEKGTEFVTKDTLFDILKTPYFQERYTHEMTGKKYFGLATFSKFPIINKGEIPFDNDPNNFCIFSDIIKERDTIRVYNAHIGSIRLQDKDYAFFGDEETGRIYQRNPEEQQILTRLKIAYEKRAIQIEAVMESIKQSPYPVVFCGDLNDTPVSYCYGQLNSELTDAFVRSGRGFGTTYIGKIPSNRIDYIFHSDALNSVQFQTHDISFSDHKPISTIINL